jgi:enoyl-CoA hydratase/carnithine racemase
MRDEGRAGVRVRVTDEGAARVLTLSNPERKNAIGPQMINELVVALEQATAAESVRVIVITGEGAAFCAGGDFGQMSGTSDLMSADAQTMRSDYVDLLHALCECTKPVIAKVNGVAMGGGLGLIACSTFAIAAESALLGTPEINVGLFPMMIMAVLARIVPQRALLKMMLLGEKLTAREGREVGLLTEVVADAELNAATTALVDKLVAKSPMATKMGLAAFAMQRDMSLNDALPALRDRLYTLLGSNDAREGLTAFLEKRKPTWTGT